MSELDDNVRAGQAVYSKRNLKSYDFVVLGVSNRWIWRCPTPALLDHYNAHVSDNHLDVGVGTGYFLDNCRFPNERPRVALMDLNQNTLDHAGQRIARYSPETSIRNVLEPIPFDGEPFDSIGLNYLLHCVPGDMASKSVAFDHLAALAKPGATVFGSTLVQHDVPRGFLARKLMAFYNSKGIFSNAQDTHAGLREQLEARFDDIQTKVVGCGVLFAGRVRAR